MHILDNDIATGIIYVSSSILMKNFYYEDGRIIDFIHRFTAEISSELVLFQKHAERRVLAELHNCEGARMYFTCYFISAHLREFFLNELHFTEQELVAFENLLPKYTGELSHDNKQGYKRAHD